MSGYGDMPREDIDGSFMSEESRLLNWSILIVRVSVTGYLSLWNLLIYVAVDVYSDQGLREISSRSTVLCAWSVDRCYSCFASPDLL